MNYPMLKTCIMDLAIIAHNFVSSPRDSPHPDSSPTLITLGTTNMVGYSPSTMSKATEEYEVDYDKNITRLYEAITSCDWDVAIDAVREIPKEARTWVVRHYEDSNDIMWRFLPIHSACARQPPASVISSLLKAYPDGARSVDDQGMYALHYACGNQASREVIRLLLVAYPQAAKIADPRGMLPIHYLACWGPSSVSIIDMVLVANRDVARTTDGDGNTALDLAREGEYPEKDAVVAALKRWFEKSKGADAEPDYGFSSPTLSKSISHESSNGRESPLTVGRLRQEVSKLRSEQRKREEELEKKMESSVSSYKSQCYDLERQLTSSNRNQSELEERNRSLETSVGRKDRELSEKDARIEELTKQLFERELERDELRQTLSDISRDAETYRRKSEHMNDRIGSLSASLSSMMDQQADLMKAMKEKEDRVIEDAAARRMKLQAMVEGEERLIKSTKFDDQSATTVAFERQAKEMDAIAAVIAAIRK